MNPVPVQNIFGRMWHLRSILRVFNMWPHVVAITVREQFDSAPPVEVGLRTGQSLLALASHFGAPVLASQAIGDGYKLRLDLNVPALGVVRFHALVMQGDHLVQDNAPLFFDGTEVRIVADGERLELEGVQHG